MLVVIFEGFGLIFPLEVLGFLAGEGGGHHGDSISGDSSEVAEFRVLEV